MYFAYAVIQAERPKTIAEQRADDPGPIRGSLTSSRDHGW